MKKILYGLFVVLLGITFVPVSVDAASLFMTSGKTKWSAKVGSNSFTTPPTVGDGCIYVANGAYVYKLNQSNGAVATQSAKLDGSNGYGTIPVTYVKEKNLIVTAAYVTGSGSYLYGLDGNTLAVKWKSSQSLGGQVLTQTVYKNGTLYTGTWSGESVNGTYVSVNADTGSVQELVSHKGGFYWAKAYVDDSYVVFGSDDGTTSNGSGTLYSYDKSGNQIDQLELDEGTGDVRSGIVKVGNYLYFTSKAGYLHKISMDTNGKLGSDQKIALGGQSTSTPVIVGDKAYVGASNKTVASILIAENQLTWNQSVATPGYVQGDMLSVNLSGKNYLYTTYNASPGGLYVISLDESLAGHSLFTPSAGQQQYCISPVVTDGNGVLYYKNDSGNIFAVEEGVETSPVATLKLAKPKLTLKAGKKKLTLKWKKVANAKGYVIYRKTKAKGKWKKIKTISKGTTTSYTNKKLKKKKKYYYRMRAYGYQNGVKKYSAYSVSKYKKTK